MATGPRPEAGLVISYAYLWHDEHRRGLEEGRKDRPGVIVLAAEPGTRDETVVVVLPITHAPPASLEDAVEMPATVKRHLGLDDQRSWVIVTEGNTFVWPGYDLRRVPGADGYDYGFLPPRFFRQVVGAFLRVHRRSRGLVKRD